MNRRSQLADAGRQLLDRAVTASGLAVLLTCGLAVNGFPSANPVASVALYALIGLTLHAITDTLFARWLSPDGPVNYNRAGHLLILASAAFLLVTHDPTRLGIALLALTPVYLAISAYKIVSAHRMGSLHRRILAATSYEDDGVAFE